MTTCGLYRFLFLLLALLLVESQPAGAQEMDIQWPDELNGWQLTWGPERFVGEALYEHINGGADLYHEYGFNHLTVLEYSRDDALLAVEVYAFDDSSKGIYSLLHDRTAQQLPADVAGRVSDYYAMFRKGRYLVTLTALSNAANTPEIFTSFASAVSGLLSSDSAERAFSPQLPEQGLIAGSRRLLAGPISLGNLAPRLSGSNLQFSAAVAGEYQLPEGQHYLFIMFPQETLIPEELEKHLVYRSGETDSPCLIVAESADVVAAAQQRMKKHLSNEK